MSTSAVLTLEQGIAGLAAIVGQEHVSRDRASETIRARPADVRQIAEVLRFANANGLSVMPSGGRTKVGWGNPVRANLEMSLARLSEVREHAWQDMTCTVQAGCRWAAMQDQLRRHGQMLGLDPLWPERATVGGVVVCNDSGALRLKYGGLRDLIIGMTVVLADGTIAKSGGKVVKNVAGYDLHKLMTGSFGTLGVIAEVNFRLHPVEEHACTWTATLPGGTPLEAFAEPMHALMDSVLVPSSVQMRIAKQNCAVDVRIAGLPECLDEYGARIRSIFGNCVLTQAAEDVWAGRQKLFEKPDSLVLKISVLPSEICAVSMHLAEWSASEGAEIEIVAQATGLITVATRSLENAPVLLNRLRASVDPGGSVVVLEVPDAMRGKLDVWGPDRGTFALMREIKRRFDPNRILNPGRFVGQI